MNYKLAFLNWKILCLSLLFVIIGCGKGSETVEIHPKENRIPYFNYTEQTKLKHEIHINKQNEEVLTIRQLLRTPLFSKHFNLSSFHKIELPLINDQEIQFESIDKNRIVLLDAFEQQLFEFHIEKNTWHKIADIGPGPGELSFANDFNVKNDMLFVVSQDARITLFNCKSSPCNYTKTIKLNSNIQPVSIVPIDSDRYIILGSQTSNSKGITTEIRTQSLFEFDYEGNIINSWGKLYDSQGHWLLLMPFSKGKIRSFGKQRKYIQYYESFPLLYHYDSNNQLEKTTLLTEFSMVRLNYLPQDGMLSIPEEDYSIIHNVTFINPNFFILSILHRQNRKITDFGMEWDETKNLYLINNLEDVSFSLGRFKNSTDEDIYFTNHHIIIKKNEYIKIAKYKTNI